MGAYSRNGFLGAAALTVASVASAQQASAQQALPNSNIVAREASHVFKAMEEAAAVNSVTPSGFTVSFKRAMSDVVKASERSPDTFKRQASTIVMRYKMLGDALWAVTGIGISYQPVLEMHNAMAATLDACRYRFNNTSGNDNNVLVKVAYDCIEEMAVTAGESGGQLPQAERLRATALVRQFERQVAGLQQ